MADNNNAVPFRQPPLIVKSLPGQQQVQINMSERKVRIPATNPDPISPQPCLIELSIPLLKQVAAQVLMAEGQREAAGDPVSRIWRPR